MPTHRSRPITPSSLAGFTLIELLVVIAIIALLIAILLPALASAKKSARSLLCQTRMRQIAVGWELYALDNDGIVVPGQPGRFNDPADGTPESRNNYDVGNGLHYRPRWFAVLGGAVGQFTYATPSIDPDDEHSLEITGELFLDPAVPDWTSTRNAPFGYNHQFLGNTRFRNYTDGEPPINFPRRAHEFYSATTVQFTTSMGTAAGKPADDRTPNNTDGSRDPERRALGGHGYVIDPPRLTPESDLADRRARPSSGPMGESNATSRSAPDPRHLGKALAAFCDGHVGAMTLRELGYATGAEGEILSGLANNQGDNDRDPSAPTNRFFSGDATDKDPPAAVN